MSKEYTLIGGNGTRVSPLEVTESGTYEAGDSRAFNPVKVNVPSGSSTLSGLTDVDISNPSNGQTLVYDATAGKWVNGESAGGGALIVHSDGEGVLDATWQEISDASDAQSVLLVERRNAGEGQYIEFFTPLAVCGYAPPVEQSGPAYIAVFGDATYTSETSDGYPAVLR